MPRIKLTIAYVGTAYCGWQIQQGHSASQPTIQAALEEAASRIVQSPVRMYGSGRTDAGVHAKGQVAHMDVPPKHAHTSWQRALNRYLPHDIRIVDAEVVHDTFHAQFDALRKSYHYRLWHGTSYTPPDIYPFVWACGPVDSARMEAAAAHLVGTYDAAALQNAGTPIENTVRTIYRVERHKEPQKGESLWIFEANGFLKQMVRNMIGLLVAVGQNKQSPEAITDILASKNRCMAGLTAPAQGLCLETVLYDTP